MLRDRWERSRQRQDIHLMALSVFINIIVYSYSPFDLSLSFFSSSSVHCSSSYQSKHRRESLKSTQFSPFLCFSPNFFSFSFPSFNH